MVKQDSIYILNNRIDCIENYEVLYQIIVTSDKKTPGYITINNVHTVIEGFWDSSYRKIINEGFLSLPDGKPLEIVGKLKGKKIISRLFGPSVMENFIDWGRRDHVRHFFIGSSEKTMAQLKKSIEEKYPGAIVAGMISPPFAPMNQWENEQYLKVINDSKPDLIWVGLGAPKQEKWMATHYKKLDFGLMLGVGAGFDYIAGNTKHAPTWMKNASLEWLFRLIQEPKRLWKRYFKTIPQFVVLAGIELTGVKLRSKK